MLQIGIYKRECSVLLSCLTLFLSTYTHILEQIGALIRLFLLPSPYIHSQIRWLTTMLFKKQACNIETTSFHILMDWLIYVLCLTCLYISLFGLNEIDTTYILHKNSTIMYLKCVLIIVFILFINLSLFVIIMLIRQIWSFVFNMFLNLSKLNQTGTTYIMHKF